MTNEDQQLRAVLANPGDDGVRLAYAEWLADHGDVDRATFVRLQIELARVPEDDPRRPVLKARERAMLAEHQDAWLGPLRPLLLEWTFRRGFLEVVVLDARVYETHAAMLHGLAPIREVMTLGGGGGG